MSHERSEEFQKIYARQRDHRWSAKVSTPEQRREILGRLRASIVKHADDVTEALFADLGKPKVFKVHSEVQNALRAIDNAILNLEDWMKPVVVGKSDTFKDAEVRLEYEGRGVVLIFGPWNFPFQLLFESLVPALAAGNTAIVKPNEMYPCISAVSARVIRDAFAEHEVAVVEGGADVANALLELPIDHVFFTGSPAVGKVVAAAAARHLASVTMELGGKCPAIIDGTFDLDTTAELIAEGRQHNSGQICLATDHVWIKEDLLDAFLEKYQAILDRKHYKDGTYDRSTMSRMVDGRNAARVQGYIDDAVKKGATLLRGGRVPDDPQVIEPAILLNVPLDSGVMQEEIFGPVLPIITYSDISEAITFLQRNHKPLAMYIFSTDDAFVRQVLAGTSSGGVTINGWASHWGEHKLPFGGVGNSGAGRYHGHFGFKELSHERAVIAQPKANEKHWLERIIQPASEYPLEPPAEVVALWAKAPAAVQA